MANLNSLIIDDTGSLSLPNGTPAQRPANTATVQSFTTVGTTSWTAPAGVTQVEVLVVAGGGAGGGRHAGGGGAGGLVYRSDFPVTPGSSYTVIVGAGGSGLAGAVGYGGRGVAGGNSQFGSLVAIGGGSAGAVGLTGTTELRSVPGTGTPGQGHNGGYGSPVSGQWAGGGGGGAGGPGNPARNNGSDTFFRIGGNGGPGLEFAITGSPTFYAGGGGGAGDSNVDLNGGLGGIGGGGRGTGAFNPTSGVAAVANTGGGGGGGRDATGGAGGSGIVIVRYATPTTGTRAVGQTRFNTQSGSLETFTGANTWVAQNGGEEIVTNGLVMNLDPARFGTGTTVYDISNTGNNGTLLNGTSVTTSYGGVFSFDGTDDRISVANSASLRPTTELTMEMWLRVPTDRTSGWTKLMGHETYSNGYLVFLESSSTQEIRALIYNNSTEIRCNTPVRLVAGNWVHVVFTFRSGDAIRSYFNAVPSTVTTLASGSFTYASTTDPIQIGGTQSPNHYNGLIGSARIYNRALTPEEVEQNYNAQCGRYNLGPKTTLGSSPRLAAESAEALRAAGITQDGPYWIKPRGQTAYLTYCKFGYIDGGDWMLLLKVHNRADMDGDSANWSNATLINENDMNLLSGSMSKYGIWNTFRFRRLMMEMQGRIPPIMIFNTRRTMYEAINATTPRANGVGVACNATDPQISTSANTRYDSMPMKQGAPFPSQTGNEPFVQQWGINVFTSGGPGGAYVGCPLDEGGHLFNNASNAGGDSGFGFGGTAGNTTRRWSCGYGEWATSAIADTLPGYIWVR